MQSSAGFAALILSVQLLGCACANLRASSLHDHDHGGQASMAAFDLALEKQFSTHSPTFGPLIKQGVVLMDLQTAISNKNLPSDVVKLVSHNASQTDLKADKAEVILEPKAVDKAVIKLNDMVVKASLRLDEKVIECMTFEEKNREIYRQVTADLARLDGEITDLSRLILKSQNAIIGADRQTASTQKEQGEAKVAYDGVHAVDAADLTIKQNDLEVAVFMLQVTKCKGTFLLQDASQARSTAVKVCEGKVQFEDGELANATSRMSAQAQDMLLAALSRSGLEEAGLESADAIAETAGFLVTDGLEDGDDSDESPKDAGQDLDEAQHEQDLQDVQDVPEGGDEQDVVLLAHSKINATTETEVESERPKGKGKGKKLNAKPPGVVTPAPITIPPAKSPPAAKAQNKCAQTVPNCGVLHDTFASLWGEMKDLVEALQDKMDSDDNEWAGLNKNFNDQVTMLTTTKGKMQTQEVEATADKGTTESTQDDKNAEKATLQGEYNKMMAKCAREKKYILWTDICGVIKVRGEVLAQGSDAQKKADATDCEVSGWLKGQCTSPCDEKLVGGTEVLSRTIITTNTKYGHICPALEWQKKCNQFKCPVDCVLSSWSEWTRCSKECGQGMQFKARRMLTNMKNGGQTCDVLTDSQQCNTFSCDRVCDLNKWTRWGPCTKACGEGFQERARSVKRVARGLGKCWGAKHWKRYGKKTCNSQKCVGDEVCVGKVDLVMLVDGSGSLSKKGWKIMQKFTLELLTRFKTSSYGLSAMDVAIVQFGNGKLSKDGIVSDAKVLSPLTSKMGDIKKALQKAKWAKGFTNMAQAFLKANQLLQRSKRQTAFPIVLLITDGKPSFKYQTATAVAEMKSRAKLVVVQIKSYPTKDNTELMKSYASKPWATNFVHIPGKKELKGAVGRYADKVLVEFCPRSESPSSIEAANSMSGFGKILESQACPNPKIAIAVPNENMCYRAAVSYSSSMKKDLQPFAFGRGSCLIYDEKCNGKKAKSNSTYNVYAPEEMESLRD